MLNGEEVDINGSEETGFIDAHEIHVPIHLEEELRQIRQGSFMRAARFTAHRARHQGIMQEQQQAQVQQMMQMQALQEKMKKGEPEGPEMGE